MDPANPQMTHVVSTDDPMQRPPRPMSMLVSQDPCVQPAAQTYQASVQTVVEPILSTPAPRCKHVILLDFAPRHSSRIAKADWGFELETKAKRVLLR